MGFGKIQSINEFVSQCKNQEKLQYFDLVMRNICLWQYVIQRFYYYLGSKEEK